jgi:hypothetical protein
MENLCFNVFAIMIIAGNLDITGAVDPPGVGPVVLTFVVNRSGVRKPTPAAVGGKRPERFTFRYRIGTGLPTRNNRNGNQDE